MRNLDAVLEVGDMKNDMPLLSFRRKRHMRALEVGTRATCRSVPDH